MKRGFLSVLMGMIIPLMSFVQVYARVFLPFGQYSQTPWTASFYFAKSGEDAPADNWYAKDFDESNWDTLEGPISTQEGGLSYYRTVWSAEYGTYWVRRHFTVDNLNLLNQIRELYFHTTHDDGCVVYLNGNLIYEYNNVRSGTNSFILNETVQEYMVEGDNVLAIRISDSGGAYAYLDCGLYGYSLVNSTFDKSSGWSGNYDRTSYDNNCIGYRYGQTFRCEQTIEGTAGLYCLSANACGMEYYNNDNTAYAHRNDELPAKLFIGNDEKAIPSAFSEMSDVDYGYCWNIGGKYVPYYADRLPWAFSRGMYNCELWSFVQPDDNGKITLGIYGNATNDISRWAAWDNLEVTYYSENHVTAMLDSVMKVFDVVNNMPQNVEVKNQTAILVNNVKSAKSYEEKAAVFANIMQYEPVVRKSIMAYEKLKVSLASLSEKLADATDATSPATISEATTLIKNVKSAYSTGTYDNEDVADAISKMETMIIRLGYIYLDIAVTTPGALGDSILGKVENFVDVQSIKISGMLNDVDLSNIQNRLSQLREIDMTEVQMTSLPDRFFYQRPLLEIVKLPAQLTTIGEYAFYQCYGLKNIVFPTTLRSINRYGFSECDNLQEVILPEGFNSMGERAFYSCDNNKHVRLPNTLTSISSDAFYYNQNLRRVEFTEGLTHINDGAFNKCNALDNLKFPSTLYYIGANAFAYNRSLSNIEFNEGLYQISDNAFYECDALTEVTLPSSLVLANASPFDYCDNLKKVTCLSIEPPYITDQIPYGVNMDGSELYVSALSINTYKQTTGWDKFQTIKPIDCLPENFTVLGNLKLTLPETIPADYKPNVSLIHDQKGTSYWHYGSLTVNGEGTLSISDFSLFWDPNYQYDQYNRNQNYCSLINNSHIRADNVSIDIFARNDKWTFISVPFDVKVSDIVTYSDGVTNWVVRKYDGQKRANGETAETWVKLGNDDILHAGEGYILQGSRYIGTNWQQGSGYSMKAINNTNKNNIFINTDATVQLNEYQSEFAHNRSWNLIGNPYPCYYDTRFMDFSAPITVWNMNNNTYTAYSPMDDSYILLPGEAFFVQCPVEDKEIMFSKEGRQTDRTVRAMQAKTRNKVAGQAVNRTVVNLSLSDGTNTDKTRIVLNNEASLQYEMDKDASKFMSDEATVPQLYTSNSGVNYAINERPFEAGVVDLCTRINVDGQYTLTLNNLLEDYRVELYDKKLNKRISLTDNQTYAFFAESGEDVNRFAVYFVNGATGISEDLNLDESKDETYSIDGVKVNDSVRKGVYIRNGKKVIVK